MAIENLIECKVLAIAISPLGFKSPWNQINNKKTKINVEELSTFRNELERKISLKTYIIGTVEVEQLVCNIENYLSNQQ